MGGAKRFGGPARYRPDVPTCDMQQGRADLRITRASPSLPRGNRLVARMKTSPGSGRTGSPSRVTPVALSRSQLPVTVAGSRRGQPRAPLLTRALTRLAGLPAA